MKKKMLAFLMAVLIVVGIFPVTAMADGNVAKIVSTSTSTEYPTLQAAIENAQDGDTVTLLKNVNITSQLEINKAITLDGDGKTITRTPDTGAASTRAGILVNAGATIKNLTVSGPNTNPSGWDSGEFGIKFFNASGATLDGVTVTGANAGIQVNGGSVIMKNNITVSGNEFGGIELCKGGKLDLTNATLVCADETDAKPVLWNDDTKGEITANSAQTLYVKAVDENKDHYYLSGEAKINATNYRTLADAIDAVGNGETITMVADVENAHGISVPSGKNFTVDFDGHTYSTEKPGAGSTNTETQAFQLLKDSTITFKNGTIQCAEGNESATSENGQKPIKRIIQNYANLTLEDMVIDGTYLNGANSVIEFANGNVNITGNTSITAKSGANAFNVDTWNAYADGAHVTVNTTGTITGNIHCYKEGYSSIPESGKSSLTIVNGKFDGIEDANAGYVDISITGGTFATKPADKFLAEGYFSKAIGDNRWKVEPKAVFDDNEEKIEIGGTEVKVNGIGGDNQPAAADAVEAINEALANTAVTTENAKNLVNNAIPTEIATDGTIVDSEVKVELQSVEVEKAGSGATITEMVFDVQPEVTIINKTTGETETKPIHKAAAPITFRLPVSSNIGNTIGWAAVYHEGKFMGNSAVKGDATNGKYIEVSSKEFSKFGYVLVDPDEAIAKVGNVPYRTLGEAVEEASGKTITVLKDTDETVIVERAMNFELVVAGNANFTGAIRPGDDYVRHIYGDKYYFELYEAGDTIVIGGNRNKDTKTETKEENPETGAPVMNMGVLAVLAVAYVATRKH